MAQAKQWRGAAAGEAKESAASQEAVTMQWFPDNPTALAAPAAAAAFPATPPSDKAATQSNETVKAAVVQAQKPEGMDESKEYHQVRVSQLKAKELADHAPGESIADLVSQTRTPPLSVAQARQVGVASTAEPEESTASIDEKAVHGAIAKDTTAATHEQEVAAVATPPSEETTDKECVL